MSKEDGVPEEQLTWKLLDSINSEASRIEGALSDGSAHLAYACGCKWWPDKSRGLYEFCFRHQVKYYASQERRRKRREAGRVTKPGSGGAADRDGEASP